MNTEIKYNEDQNHKFWWTGGYNFPSAFNASPTTFHSPNFTTIQSKPTPATPIQSAIDR